MISLTIEGLKEGKKYEDVGAGDRMTHIHPELKQGGSCVQLRHSFPQPCFLLMEDFSTQNVWRNPPSNEMKSEMRSNFLYGACASCVPQNNIRLSESTFKLTQLRVAHF